MVFPLFRVEVPFTQQITRKIADSAVIVIGQFLYQRFEVEVLRIRSRFGPRVGQVALEVETLGDGHGVMGTHSEVFGAVFEEIDGVQGRGSSDGLDGGFGQLEWGNVFHFEGALGFLC